MNGVNGDINNHANSRKVIQTNKKKIHVHIFCAEKNRNDIINAALVTSAKPKSGYAKSKK